MDRRDFLKRSIAASAAVAAALSIDSHDALAKAIAATEAVKWLPSGRTPAYPGAPGPGQAGRIGILRTSRLVCGGNLFNGYAHGRDSVDGADLRLHRTRLSQTGFLAGWQPGSDLGSHQFSWKGAY
jgi:hypothetical protein